MRWTRFLLLAFSCLLWVGCARHYVGTVIDVRRRPVAYARVEGRGIHGTFAGEGLFVVRTVADADGKFVLATSDWPSEITATAPDSHRKGRVFPGLIERPYVIVVH